MPQEIRQFGTVVGVLTHTWASGFQECVKKVLFKFDIGRLLMFDHFGPSQAHTYTQSKAKCRHVRWFGRLGNSQAANFVIFWAFTCTQNRKYFQYFDGLGKVS